MYSLERTLFYNAKEEGQGLFKCLMVYHNTPLSNTFMVMSANLQRADLRDKTFLSQMHPENN